MKSIKVQKELISQLKKREFFLKNIPITLPRDVLGVKSPNPAVVNVTAESQMLSE